MKRVGLFVGIDKYQDIGIAQLKCAVKDATALMASFSKAQYDKVASLLNDARTEDILFKAENLMENLDSGDLFVFYFPDMAEKSIIPIILLVQPHGQRLHCIRSVLCRFRLWLKSQINPE